MMNPSSHETVFRFGLDAADDEPSTERFGARDLLARAPELRDDPAALLDLAYEEYCQAIDRGQTIDQREFAAQFPMIEQSLLDLLEVHSFVIGNSFMAAVESEAAWPTPGEVFLGFELLEEIGKGAYSRVFLAREVGLGHRQVVVKVSRKGADEAAMLGLLDHPNIVPVHSITSDSAVKLSALCMPYLGRTTADEWIQTRFKSASGFRAKSRRHLESVIEIGIGVCQGLRFAHAHQIFHCDIKPSNILITHDGEPLLLDFNLSTNQAQETHLVGGTLMYMAPEQLLRASGSRTAKITASTDVFCLGATLYQMATGQLPFPLEGSSQLRLKDAAGAALAMREAFHNRSHPLADPLLSTLREALAFDPRHRIPSASEFYDRLCLSQNQLVRPRSRWLWPVSVSALVAVSFASAKYLNEKPQPQALVETPIQNPFETPPASAFPPIVEEDPLQLAQQAERNERYPQAIEAYRQVLNGELEHPKEVQWAVQHSLAFCLLMDGQHEEANQWFAGLQAVGYKHEALELNQLGCLVLFALDQHGVNDQELIQTTKLRVRNLAISSPPSSEFQHVLAVFEALLAKLELGGRRNAALQRAVFCLEKARLSGLSDRKALAIGHLMPEAMAVPPLSRLLEDHPELTPDLEVDVPVQSPLTMNRVAAKAMLR